MRPSDWKTSSDGGQTVLCLNLDYRAHISIVNDLGVSLRGIKNKVNIETTACRKGRQVSEYFKYRLSRKPSVNIHRKRKRL